MPTTSAASPAAATAAGSVVHRLAGSYFGVISPSTYAPTPKNAACPKLTRPV